jgi:hypothetical protein
MEEEQKEFSAAPNGVFTWRQCSAAVLKRGSPSPRSRISIVLGLPHTCHWGDYVLRVLRYAPTPQGSKEDPKLGNAKPTPSTYRQCQEEGCAAPARLRHGTCAIMVWHDKREIPNCARIPIRSILEAVERSHNGLARSHGLGSRTRGTRVH